MKLSAIIEVLSPQINTSPRSFEYTVVPVNLRYLSSYSSFTFFITLNQPMYIKTFGSAILLRVEVSILSYTLGVI